MFSGGIQVQGHLPERSGTTSRGPTTAIVQPRDRTRTVVFERGGHREAWRSSSSESDLLLWRLSSLGGRWTEGDEAMNGRSELHEVAGGRTARAVRILMTLALAAGTAHVGATIALADPKPSSSSANPPGWIEQVEESLAAQEYEISWQKAPASLSVPESWQAPNRSQGFRTWFMPDGIRVVPRSATTTPAWQWGLSLVGYGENGRTWAVASPRLDTEKQKISYHRDGIEERYENKPRGLEQQFTLDAPAEEVAASAGVTRLGPWPGAATRGSSRMFAEAQSTPALVKVDMALWGDLTPRIAEDGQAIDFVTPSGASVVHYAQLEVTDARGEKLPSWMEGFAVGDVRGIRIVIDARDAFYPLMIDPLATSPAWTVQGAQPGSQFGTSVASAGDVNGDGYSDVIVGAHQYEDGEYAEGAAFLYLSSASGLSTTPAWSDEGDETMLEFGISVSTAGDVNGDGYADVIVGGADYNSVTMGVARLYLGSPSGLSPTAAWTAQAEPVGTSTFGDTVAAAGDVNGDGYADVIIGD